VTVPPESRWTCSTASGVPTFSASPPSTRFPLAGCSKANFTDELPELSTSTNPASVTLGMLRGGG